MSGNVLNVSNNYVMLFLRFHIFTAQIYSTSPHFKHFRCSLLTMPVNNLMQVNKIVVMVAGGAEN